MTALGGIQNVVEDAFRNSNGTIQGFFLSVAAGFAAMVQQIIAEMVALLAVAAIAGIISAIGGAGFNTGFKAVISQGSQSGSMGGGILGGVFGGGAQGKASGGYIAGRGTSTSDSIAAWLSNGEFVQRAKAVQYYGRDFFERLNQMAIPRMALAGGGMVGGSMPLMMPSVTNSNSSSTKQTVQNYLTMQINTPNAESFRRSQGQIMREAQQKLDAQRMKKGF